MRISTVAAPSSTIAIGGDAGNADGGTGSTITLDGTLEAANGVMVSGNADNDIVELNPANGAEIKRIVSPEQVSGVRDGLAFDGNSLWLINGDGSNTLYQLDPETGAVIDADVINDNMLGLASDFDGLAALGTGHLAVALAAGHTRENPIRRAQQLAS